MFWKLTALSTASPVEAVLDKENFTLEELLDEEEIIQECKALNSRLINFLRDRAQVDQLLRFIIEDPPEDADNKRTFKFPFIACEIFTCEIDVILKTLVEEVELMDLLFSFLKPDRPHSAQSAGYFSKVVVCLMLRKTAPLINYVQAHPDVLQRLVDLIGITSIMEVLLRLVGVDDHMYPNFTDVMRWLAESNLLEMIVDKLNPSNPPEVHANAAETLCAVSRNYTSALATELASPSFITRIFGHALEESTSKSGLIYSLSVCISLLNPKRSVSPPLFHSYRNQHMYESTIPVSPDTVNAMLPKLGDLLMLLNVSSDDTVLPTTYGELKPPLGKHRLKIIEFIAVLLKSGNEVTENELVSSGAIQRIIDLFFEYPYNNALHHHVENIITSCLESGSSAIIDHLLKECDLIGKILQMDKHPVLANDTNKPTVPASGKQAPRAGNIGHITRISNKLVQMGSNSRHIAACLLNHNEWSEWQAAVLQERNAVENVYRWGCGRPTALQDRNRDSDDDDHDKDYDVAALANNLSQAFRYNMYDHGEAEEESGALDRDDEDVYFDDESAEVVISSLRLGDDQGSLFTNSNWFAFDNGIENTPASTSQPDMLDEVNLNRNGNSGNNSSDDEVVVGEDGEFSETQDSVGVTSSSEPFFSSIAGGNQVNANDVKTLNDKASTSQFMTLDGEDLFGDRPVPDWAEWGESQELQFDGSSVNPFDYNTNNSVAPVGPLTVSPPSENPGLQNGSADVTEISKASPGTDSNQTATHVPSLFEDDVEFVGVEIEGTEKAMEHALKEGIVGEAGPLKRNMIPSPEKEQPRDDGGGAKEFNDANYWRVEQEVAVVE
uniref:SIT4 phosphatase-associated family protein n=1 Tax=Kalanchoe fedtschenkoi TaxID=63787 RepID=A0A7N1A0A7_KALFE